MRTLLRTTLVLLASLPLAAPLLAADPTWIDSTRDVWVDGRLDRAAQVLSADGGKRLGGEGQVSTCHIRGQVSTCHIRQMNLS